MQGHALEFQRLPASMQDKYEEDAKATALRKTADHRNKKHALEEKVRLAAEKKAQELRSACSLRAARFGWSEDDLACLTRSFNGPHFPQALVDVTSVAELQGPLEKPPLELRQAMKDADDGSWEEEVPLLPEWVAGVCRQRIACSGVAFRFGCSADSPTFMVGHASQSPMWAAFYHLRRRRLEGAAGSSGDAGVLDLPARQPHRHLWSVEHHEFFFEDSCRLRAPPSDVIPGCHFESGCIVFSDTDAIPYDTWIESLPPAPKGTHRHKKKDKEEKDDTMLARHDPRRLAAVHGLVGAGKRGASLAHFVADLDGEEMAAVYAAVAAARLDLAMPHEDDEELLFEVAPRGGCWTKKHTGMAINEYRCQPAGKATTAWMSKFWPSGKRSCTASIAMGTDIAIGLCKVWCSLMEGWYNAWKSHGSHDDYMFGGADLEGCTPAELLTTFADMADTNPAKKRWLAMGLMMPRRQ